MTDSQSELGEEKINPQVAPRRRSSRPRRWLLWTGAIVLLVIVAVGITVAVLLRRAEPMLRAALIDTLQKRFHARVELDDLRVAILDGFWVEGNGLRIWLPDEAVQTAEGATDPNAAWKTEPWITAATMRFHASWRILPGQPVVISVIHVDGVRVLLPPKEDRPHLSLSVKNAPGDASPQQPATGAASLIKMPQILVRKIECQDAHLVIERRQEAGKPPKIPLDFELRHAVLFPDGHGGPIAYEVDLVNAKPIGQVHTTGHFGPWVPSDPGALPVQGDYRFDHADLSTIKGIAGILSSTGHYTGTLRRIEVQGETKTPDFRLERLSTSSGVNLTTQFHAIVDGTNGDVWLDPVNGMLGDTHILAKGKVVRESDLIPGAHGHDTNLEVTIDRGRIEDILHISASAGAPFMTGNLTLQNHFHLPPNPEGQKISVWDRLELDGQFHLSQSQFSNANMQGKIEQLSLRGQGKPKEVKTTDATSILSDMQGRFQLSGGYLHLPDLSYQVPGAQIVAHGTYGLKDGSLAFEGDAKLDATISKVVGGWKGFLLKPVDRYLEKNGAGTDVPIHVSGTRKEPKFGVDFDRLGKNTEADERTPHH